MNTLSYKGFLGSVNFSEKDSVFFGKVEGIDGLVNFEGESVTELTDAFPSQKSTPVRTIKKMAVSGRFVNFAGLREWFGNR